jgi:LemA protein
LARRRGQVGRASRDVGHTVKKTFVRALFALAIISAPLGLSGCGINAIPTKQETAKARWADVQAAYQRRADLVPNLVATVQANAQQERTVLTEVTEARARATAVNIDPSTVTDPAKFQQFQQAQDALSGSLGRLLAVSERYPTLQSNQNFLALQSQLEGTENRIEIARRDYNDAVRDYNTTLRVLPTSIWAHTFYGADKEMQPFAASEAAQTAPQVHFNIGGPTPGAAPPAPASNAPAQ